MSEYSEPKTRLVRRAPTEAPSVLQADIVVLGAGIAGISAALEAAALGRSVILVDAAAQLGGQSTSSLIGTFCGLYSNGKHPYRVTYGIADQILAALDASQACHLRRGRNTAILMYRETALARWIETAVVAAGIRPLLGATLLEAVRTGRRIEALHLATRFGQVRVEAEGFVDASGDAALAYAAGLPCHEPDAPIMGTLMFSIEDFDEPAALQLDRWEMQRRLQAKAQEYGLVRRDGFVFAFPGQGQALVNMTHVATPLDAIGQAEAQIAGRAQADRVLSFLRSEYAAVFGRARVRSYGLLGIRQTRWIVGRDRLTTADVRNGRRHSDAILRCSWPIELHDSAEDVHWEEFADDHMHFVPFGAMVPVEADNLVAAGRCIDGETAALSSVRVMGPCIAMGAAAAKALDLAGSGSVHQIDIAALQSRLQDNLHRQDPVE